ncbi:MAG: hypothetical protein FWH12_01830 [Treponema sp.]|nr:hypothetical protein [Treponema sp.]
MENSQIIYILIRLILGAAVSFLAIMVWSKTRDLVWLLFTIASITAYAEAVVSIAMLLGYGAAPGSLAPLSMVLTALPPCFFIAALSVFLFRRHS